MGSSWPFGDLKPHHYRTISIDPPWHFAAGTKSRPQHYNRMPDAEIAALSIGELAHPDGAHVFLWVTSPRFFLIPLITKAWGARYAGRAFVWIKTRCGWQPCYRHRLHDEEKC